MDRRTNFTRSLAVMSMVGYILGLGDRHPSNLMLDRFSGKVIHIDFGDCFEVAMLRDKFPERVPFRLTRMLVNAMEVSGIEGTFRITCENVMRVLRENKESLMAVLEAFVYDPLINWRLLPTASPKAGPDAAARVSVGRREPGMPLLVPRPTTLAGCPSHTGCASDRARSLAPSTHSCAIRTPGSPGGGSRHERRGHRRRIARQPLASAAAQRERPRQRRYGPPTAPQTLCRVCANLIRTGGGDVRSRGPPGSRRGRPP